MVFIEQFAKMRIMRLQFVNLVMKFRKFVVQVMVFYRYWCLLRVTGLT